MSSPKTSADAARLAFLRAVYAAEADAFSMVAIQDFDGVADDHFHNSSSEVGGKNSSWDEQGCQQQEWCPVWNHDCCEVATNCHRVVRR